jgi:hypothetical protein
MRLTMPEREQVAAELAELRRDRERMLECSPVSAAAADRRRATLDRNAGEIKRLERLLESGGEPA